MKTTLTDFQRKFRLAREAADRGESVIVEGETATYVFEKYVARNPFEGLEGVFGAVKQLQHPTVPAREKIRGRLRAKFGRR